MAYPDALRSHQRRSAHRDSWTTLTSDTFRSRSRAPPASTVEHDGSPKPFARALDSRPVRWSTCTLASDLSDPSLSPPCSDLSAGVTRPAVRKGDQVYTSQNAEDSEEDDTSFVKSSHNTSRHREERPLHLSDHELHTPARVSSLAHSTPVSTASPSSVVSNLAEPIVGPTNLSKSDAQDADAEGEDGQADEEDVHDTELDSLLAQTMRALELSNNLLLSTLASRARLVQLRTLESSINADMDRREQDVRKQLQVLEQMTDFVGQKSDQLRNLVDNGSASLPFRMARAHSASASVTALDSLPLMQTASAFRANNALRAVGIGILEAQDSDMTIGKTAAKRLEKVLLNSTRLDPIAQETSSSNSSSPTGKASRSGRLGVISADHAIVSNEPSASPASRRLRSLSNVSFSDTDAVDESCTESGRLALPDQTVQPSSSTHTPAPARATLDVRKRSSRGSSLASIVEQGAVLGARHGPGLWAAELGSAASSRRSSLSSKRLGDVIDAEDGLVTDNGEGQKRNPFVLASRLTSSSSTGTIKATATASAERAVLMQKRAVSHGGPSDRSFMFPGSTQRSGPAPTPAPSSFPKAIASPILSSTAQSVHKTTRADDFDFNNERSQQAALAGLPHTSGSESESTYATLLSSTSASGSTARSSYFDTEGNGVVADYSNGLYSPPKSSSLEPSMEDRSSANLRSGFSAPRRYSVSKRSSFGASSDRDRHSAAAQLQAEDVMWRADRAANTADSGGGALRALQRLNEMSAASLASDAISASGSNAPPAQGSFESKRLSIGLGLPGFAALRSQPTTTDDSERVRSSSTAAQISSTAAASPEGPAATTLSGWRNWTPWTTTVVSSSSAANVEEQQAHETAQNKTKSNSARKPSIPSLLNAKSHPTTATVIGT